MLTLSHPICMHFSTRVMPATLYIPIAPIIIHMHCNLYVVALKLYINFNMHVVSSKFKLEVHA